MKKPLIVLGLSIVVRQSIPAVASDYKHDNEERKV
jgi:hypothetical protein